MNIFKILNCEFRIANEDEVEIILESSYDPIQFSYLNAKEFSQLVDALVEMRDSLRTKRTEEKNNIKQQIEQLQKHLKELEDV